MATYETPKCPNCQVALQGLGQLPIRVDLKQEQLLIEGVVVGVVRRSKSLG